MRFVVFQLFATPGALVLVGPRVDVAYAYLGLHAPTPRQHPLVAVGYAGTQHPPLVAVVGQLAEIGAQELEAASHVTNIIYAAQHMRAKEVPVEALAQPIASLRLNEPVLPLGIVTECPRIEIAREVYSPSVSYADLHAQVQRCGGVV